MRRTALTLILLSLGFAQLGRAQDPGSQSTPAPTNTGDRKVYTTVGKHGERVYTDQKTPGATPVEVDDAQTYKAQRPLATTQGNRSLAPVRQDANFRYQICAIAQPANDQTFVNPESIPIAARSEPAVRPGDIMTILFNGSAVGAPGSPTAVVSPVLRGSHSIAVVIRDAQGATLCSSASVTIHVRQPTVGAGNRARQNTAQPRPRP